MYSQCCATKYAVWLFAKVIFDDDGTTLSQLTSDVRTLVCWRLIRLKIEGKKEGYYMSCDAKSKQKKGQKPYETECCMGNTLIIEQTPMEKW